MARLNACCYFNQGEWHHYALTFDRSALEFEEYIDGTSTGSGSSDLLGDDLSTIGISLGIGAVPSDIDSSRYFNGEIDEVRIWNVVRPQSQIQATMNDTLGPEYYSTADSGLVANFRFDQLENLGIGDDGLADDIRDLSVNGNHGDLKGDAMLVLSDSPVKVEESRAEIPSEFYLSQNYPNPFNPSTTIQFSLPRLSFVTLRVNNILGEEVTILVAENLSAGNYKVEWDASGLASGVYYYRLQAGEFVETKKLTLLK